jgi:hypothetical protein
LEAALLHLLRDQETMDPAVWEDSGTITLLPSPALEATIQDPVVSVLLEVLEETTITRQAALVLEAPSPNLDSLAPSLHPEAALNPPVQAHPERLPSHSLGLLAQ